MMTIDLNNVVILLDGIWNNHEIELTTFSNKRVWQVVNRNPSWVWFFKDETRKFIRGKYIYNPEDARQLVIAVYEYGDFSMASPNSNNIESVGVASMFMKCAGATRESIIFSIGKRLAQGQGNDVHIAGIYTLDDLARKAKPRQSTKLEEIYVYIREKFIQPFDGHAKTRITAYSERRKRVHEGNS